MTAPFVVTSGLAVDAIAPDGSEVRFLAGLSRGGMASFSIGPGEVSIAVRHRTVEELWVFTAGRGEIWISPDRDVTTPAVTVHVGDCVRVPVGASFQFRSSPETGLTAVGVTMPPWPGDGEAIRTVGPWPPTLSPGPGLATE
jgi:mannose-6-phosphate isomerase-like protein (cupin superfamily)